MPPRKSKRQSRVSKKIRILRKENVPQRQAVATALNMERRHRIGPNGEYRRVGRKKSKRRSSRR